MLKLVQEITDQMVPYDKAVIEGKKIISEIEGHQWALADLANCVEPKYGDATLKKLGEDIGINFHTLERLRSVARAWPENRRRRLNSFAVHQDLMAHPNRHQMLLDNPNLTTRQARKLSTEHRTSVTKEDVANEEVVFPYQEECTDCNTAQEQWQRSLGNMLGDILSFRSYWDHLFGPEWNKYELPSSHLTLAAQAKKEFTSLVASLKEHPHDEEN